MDGPVRSAMEDGAGAGTLSRGEHEFRRLLDLLPAAAYMCDPDGLITYYNSTAARLWGRAPRLFDPEDRYCGSFKLFYADGRPMAHDECWMARALTEKDAFNGQEVVIECSDGRRVTALAHANPILENDGRLAGAVNVLVDITERKEMEDALRQSVRARTDFLATLSHELRNPLAPIRNALELLRDADVEPAEADEALTIIDRQLSHLVRLVDELLDVSRVDRDKITLQKERVVLQEVVASAIETVAHEIEARDQSLDVRLPDDEVPLHADFVRLAQVVQNLLDNAAKYSPRGASIELDVRAADGQAHLSVTDHGMGISEEDFDAIFRPFAQLDHRLERETAGLGIGLALVRRLVELHGGTVTAESDGPGTGSRFAVCIPLGSPDATPEAAAAATTGAARAPRRVLVADDNRDSAATLAALLEMSGHETHVAHDGNEAVALFEQHRPDVVVLDIAMPRLSGCDAARIIRERHPDARPLLIAMTGWGQPEDIERTRDAGFDHHLVKPLDPSKLRELLARDERDDTA